MSKKKIEIVVATDLKQGIGYKNTLPWHLKSDLAHFKQLTTTCKANHQNAVIMGRHTWDSLPQSVKPLPNRYNVVLSKDPHLSLPHDVLQAHGLDEALELLSKTAHIDKIFVIGGAQLYRAVLGHPLVQTLHITKIYATYTCDTFFPDPAVLFTQIHSSPIQEENGISFSFETWIPTS